MMEKLQQVGPMTYIGQDTVVSVDAGGESV